MTDIDNRSARSAEKTDEERFRGEVSRLADHVSAFVQRESNIPEVQILASGLVFAALAKGYGCSFRELRSQLESFWRSMGGVISTGSVVEVVTPEAFENLMKGAGR